MGTIIRCLLPQLAIATQNMFQPLNTQQQVNQVQDNQQEQH